MEAAFRHQRIVLDPDDRFSLLHDILFVKRVIERLSKSTGIKVSTIFA